MNVNGLANMMFRRLMRKGLNVGVQKALDATGPKETAQDQQRRAQAQQGVRRVNQAMRMIRMMGRMR